MPKLHDCSEATVAVL